MARITYSICDLCGGSSEEELLHKISLSGTPGQPIKHGEICAQCYGALVKQLEQETKPVLPRARRTSTPSKTGKSPVPSLDAIGIMDTGLGVVGKSSAMTYIDNDEEMKVVPSTLTDAVRRQINLKIANGPCRHDSGFSLKDDGPYCKDCNQKVKI